MMSSTKPEIRNVLHCRQRRTERQPQVTCTEIFGDVWNVWILRYAREHTDKRRYVHHADRNTLSPMGGGVK